jgi:hypothetical protein
MVVAPSIETPSEEIPGSRKLPVESEAANRRGKTWGLLPRVLGRDGTFSATAVESMILWRMWFVRSEKAIPFSLQ